MKSVALLLVLCVVASACAGPGQPAIATAPAATASVATGAAQASGSTPTTVSAPDALFPAEAAGLPVVSVAEAAALIGAGKLDGRVAAVAGYYDQVSPSCPYPGRYIGPLESWCGFTAFTDRSEDARLCRPSGDNGTTCSAPTATNLSPFLMPETGGALPALGNGLDPVPLVLVGHAGDARQWRCTEQTRSACARAFVVDRVVWADGHAVPLTAPQTGDLTTGKIITPRMTLVQAAAAAGIGDSLLTGAPFRAGDIASIDPRENLAGNSVVWLLRSIGQGAGATRPVTEEIVDDATGKLIDTLPLAPDPAYRPARVWQSAILRGAGCCGGHEFPFYRVVASDGTVVHDGLVSGGASGGAGYTAFGTGYESPGPLVLPAGSYSVTAWLATWDGSTAGPARDQCSTTVTLAPLDDTALSADFPTGKPCQIARGPLPTSDPMAP
ncbi:MAG: hypothetical protein M0Z49_07155 [Chloroflexi bacterium]|nr:hypothetical protein [Chloroflexota bacterium]